MLSIFPDLLVYTLVAPVILRLSAGILLFVWGIKSFGNEKHAMASRLSEWNLSGKHAVLVLGLIEIVVGVFIVAGSWTQPSALIATIITAVLAYISRKESFGGATSLVYLLVAIISCSLLFTGPGFFAFDLPL